MKQDSPRHYANLTYNSSIRTRVRARNTAVAHLTHWLPPFVASSNHRNASLKRFYGTHATRMRMRMPSCEFSMLTCVVVVMFWLIEFRVVAGRVGAVFCAEWSDRNSSNFGH